MQLRGAVSVRVFVQQSGAGAAGQLAAFGGVGQQAAVGFDGFGGGIDDQDFFVGLEPFFDAVVGVADHGAAEGG